MEYPSSLHINDQDNSFGNTEINEMVSVISQACSGLTTVAVRCRNWKNMLVAIIALQQSKIMPLVIAPMLSTNETDHLHSAAAELNDVQDATIRLRFIDRKTTKEKKPNDACLVIFSVASNNIKESRLTSFALNKCFDSMDHHLLAHCLNGVTILEGFDFAFTVILLLWLSRRPVSIAIFSQHYFRNFNTSVDFSIFYFGSYVEEKHGNKYQSVIETAKFADREEFKAIWTPERHFNNFGGLFPNPAVLSASLAAVTNTIKIRSGSVVAPLHHSIRIVEDWSLVDNLSNGRVGISLGSGWQPNDFIFYPENYTQRHQVMLDKLEEIRKLWRGEEISFRDGLGNNVAPKLFPRPIQRDLPIWITASENINTFIDCGRFGCNLLTHMLWQDSDDLVTKINAYRKALADSGFDPKEKTVTVMLHTFIAETDEQAEESVREPLKKYIGQSVQLVQAMIKNNDGHKNRNQMPRYGDMKDALSKDELDQLLDIAFDRFCKNASLIGSIGKCEQLVRKLIDAGINEIACLVDFGLPEQTILNGLSGLSTLKNKFRPNTKQNQGLLFCDQWQLKQYLTEIQNDISKLGMEVAVCGNRNSTAHDNTPVPLALDYSDFEKGVIQFQTKIETPGKQAAVNYGEQISEEF